MKKIFFSALMLVLAMFVSTNIDAQAGSIPLDIGMDKSKLHIMLSDTTFSENDYRYGKSKWFEFDTVKQWILDEAGGGSAYYEFDARMFYDVAQDTMGIDTIFLNTFPGNWTIDVGNNLSSGFEFNCNDCDATVDFTNTFPLTASDYTYGSIQQGWDGGSTRLWFPHIVTNNGKSLSIIGYELSGDFLTDSYLTAYPYWKLKFRAYPVE